jgi:hypothetical protein
MTPADFLKEARARLADTPFTIVTPTPEVLSGALGPQGGLPEPIAVESVQNVLAPLVGLLAARRACRGLTDSSLTLDANYVRRTDAELKWKGI